MPNISYESFGWWSNYHMTVTMPPASAIREADISAGDLPIGVVEMAHAHVGDVMDHTPVERLGLIAAALQGYLRHIAQRIDDPDFVPGVPFAPKQPFAAGMVGTGWSFAPLIGTPMAQLMCGGLSHAGLLPDDHRAAGCPVPGDRLVIAGGGTRLRELVNWAEPRGLSIPTSGSFLGPTLAGGAATASHGSRLGFGGAQDMIVGLHLVTGPDRHWWLEREGAPVLSDAGLKALAAGGTVPTVRRDTELFEAALVHLGAMGIVAGMAVAMVPRESYRRFRKIAPLGEAMLADIAAGRFEALAQALGRDEAPVFYELTIDPHAPFGPSALHTLYLEDASEEPGEHHPASVAGSAVVRLATRMFGGNLAKTAGDAALVGADDPFAKLLEGLMDGHDSAFDYYRASPGFTPQGTLGPAQSWGALHDTDALTGGVPGALYNASFAIPRARLPEALTAICAAVAALPATFIFTVRFVSNARGTLAFTRFAETAVIEIDGLSPFICNKAAAHPDQHGNPLPPEAMAGLRFLAQVLPTGAHGVRQALETAGMPYAMHWGKLGDLDAAKVHADYGDPADPATPLGRWRKARAVLLDDWGQAIFRNPAVETYGVVA